MATYTIDKIEYEGNVYELQDNKSGYITGYTETDPTVPAWAKATTKPTYTASEIIYNAQITVAQEFNNKVDKIQGKGLSTNDYTTAEQTKLAGIEEGAEVNVQSDWNQATITADDYIKNKPTIPNSADEISFENDQRAQLLEGCTDVDAALIVLAQADEAFASHSHGYITNSGAINTSVAIASGDKLVISDESDSKVAKSTITFGSSTTQFLANNGTWQTISTEDTKVTNTLATTTKYYVTGTTSSSTNTGTQSFDSGIYATTTAGQLNATTYKVNEQVTLQWNSTDSTLDFIFA